MTQYLDCFVLWDASTLQRGCHIFAKAVKSRATNPIIGGLGGPSWECDGSYSCYVPAGGQIRYITSGSASDPVRVPEPLTLSLFGAGLAGAAAMRRRKKAKQA
jgi:hypothetical protein